MTKAAQAMKKAWEIFRKAGVRSMDAWKAALRQAWALVKGVVKVAGLDMVRGYALNDSDSVVTEAHVGWSKGWLAKVKLSAVGAKYDLDSNFISASYRELSRAGNGNITYKLSKLEDGIYEADSVYRSGESFRLYFRVENHSVVEVFDSKDDAKVALQSA